MKVRRCSARLRFVQVLALFLFGLVVSASTALGQGSTSEVIRVYDVPQSDYSKLRFLGDFWGINWRDNYVNMNVTERGREAVETLGYRVETDLEKQAEVERFRAIDQADWRARGLGGIAGFACYRTVDETTSDLAALALAHPELARWEDIGDSWHKTASMRGGDEIWALILGNNESPHEKAPLVVMAAQHARELATAESATRFAEWLVNGYVTNPTARWLLDHREIHIIAIQNPDGRREVEGDEPFWRKNANTNFCAESLPGVDLNRNSPVFFGNQSSSGSACSEVFRGLSASSEPETTAIQNYLRSVFTDYRDDFDDAIPNTAEGIFHSIHSFGELILFPWEGLGGGSENNAPNHDQLAWLGRKLGFFTDYRVGRTALGPAGGTTVDFAHGELGVAAYTYEIGTTFQQSCSSFESTIWPRVLDSLIYSAKAAARPYAAPLGPDVVDLAVNYDLGSNVIRITGLADDTRYDRNGSPEAPFNDPISAINIVTASLDVPPALATATIDLVLNTNGSVADFSGTLDVNTLDLSTPRLLFVQASDSDGNSGVPEAIWIRAQLFQDRFEGDL